MRSSPSGPEPLRLPTAGFAHRGLHGAGVPENSMAAFRAAIAKGAGIECDVRLSADDVPMLFHDADLERLCGERLKVGRTSAAVLAGKRLAESSETVPRLAELLMLAAGRVPLLLELKSNANAARLAAAVSRAVGPRPGSIGVMSFDVGVAAWLVRHRPDLRRGLVLSGRDSCIVRWTRLMRARPHFVAIHRTALGEPWVRRLRVPIYSWTIRTAAERTAAAPLAAALIWEADGRP